MAKFKWKEQLPAGCPPLNAKEPDETVYYRLAKTSPPTDACFGVTLIKFPPKQFDPEFECRKMAVSLFRDLEQLMKCCKIGEHKLGLRVSIRLPKGSGLIAQTGRPEHFSWWRAAGFDAAEHCNPVPP